jgi:Protein of unknown function (DUF3800)
LQLCYVDESGTAETLLDTDPRQQPVIVIAGVSLPERDLSAVTHEWIELKTRFYPSIGRQGHGWLDAILHDMKGAKLRKGFRVGASGRRRKQAVGLIDGVLGLLERHEARIVGRVWVKRLGVVNKDMSIHGASLQFICAAFDAGLPRGERGMVVVDSQTYQHNHRLAHSVFTQRFGTNPQHRGLVDLPVFGHSDNHAGLQIADFLCSAVLAPVACAVYAGGYAGWNTHCDSGYLDIRERFGERLQALTFTWRRPGSGGSRDSVAVSDPITKRGARLMWGPASAAGASGPAGGIGVSRPSDAA